jgi:hypothetical protein
MSSVASAPGAALPMPVPELMTNRSDPTSTSPVASVARLSFSQFAAKFEKSWSKARHRRSSPSSDKSIQESANWCSCDGSDSLLGQRPFDRAPLYCLGDDSVWTLPGFIR